MQARFVDETDFGFGWVHPEPRFMQRTSHALVADGGVWLVDPTEAGGVHERIGALGQPVAGVVELVERHARDGRAFAERYGVEVRAVPWGGISGAPFRPVGVSHVLFGQEIELWWPERRVLVVGDALGTAPYYLAAAERLAVHPLLRAAPPHQLRELEPRHVLSGHGQGVHGDEATPLLREALATARRRAPRWLLGVPYRLVTARR